jgi:NADH-quinone oxidoreductase subunit M
MLPMVQRVFFNRLESDENRQFEDVSGRELAILAPLCALMIWIGWNPTPFLERMEPSVRAVLERVEQFAPTAADAEASGGAVGPAAAPRAE